MKTRLQSILIIASVAAWITLLLTQYLLLKDSYGLASSQIMSDKWTSLADVIDPDDLQIGPQGFLIQYTRQVSRQMKDRIQSDTSEFQDWSFSVEGLDSIKQHIDALVKNRFGNDFEYGLVPISWGRTEEHNDVIQFHHLEPAIENNILGNLTSLEDAIPRGTMSTGVDDLYLFTRIYFRDISLRQTVMREIWAEIILAALSFILLTALLVWTISRVLLLQNESHEQSEYIDNLKTTFESPIASIQETSAHQLRHLSEGNLEEASKLGSHVHAQAARLRQIVDHLRDRPLQELKDSLNIRETSLTMLFEHCIEDIKINYPDNPTNVSVTIHPPDLHIMADPYYLKTAIINILDNSFLYNRDNEELYVEISAQETYEQVKIRIADNGIGLDHLEVAKIGKKYYRPAQHRHINGMGLGLFQVIQIVKAHEGRVKFQGDTTAGLSVEITLPIT